MTAASQAMNFTFLYALCLSEWLQQHVKACFTHQGHNFTPVGTGWSLSCTRLRPNSQRQSSLKPKASLDPQTEQQNGHFGQTDLRAALLPPPHTQSPRREQAPCFQPGSCRHLGSWRAGRWGPGGPVPGSWNLNTQKFSLLHWSGPMLSESRDITCFFYAANRKTEQLDALQLVY